MPGIKARNYTIISKYMRYKYNPNALVNRKGLWKYDWYIHTKMCCKWLRPTSSNIWSCIKGCNEEVIWACGVLPEGPPPHEVWNISHTLGNHRSNLLHHWTIKYTDHDHVLRSWRWEKIKSKGYKESLCLIQGIEQWWKLEPRYTTLQTCLVEWRWGCW